MEEEEVEVFVLLAAWDCRTVKIVAVGLLMVGLVGVVVTLVGMISWA